jgi:tetratricopeptide (TPR) repeat protein
MSKGPLDPRSFEKMSQDIARLLEGKEFSSDEELNRYVKGVLDKGKPPEFEPQTTREIAQNMMYDSWEISNRKKRIKIAYRALSVFPDCADAYITLAEDEAGTIEQAAELYQRAVDSGARALGEKAFKENSGHFWGVVGTRPYMRARAALAQTLWEMGKHNEALDHYREMLKLNPNDNQGIRYVLAACLGELERWAELDRFINIEWRRDPMPNFGYLRLLLAFHKEGDSPRARRMLKNASEYNKHVPDYLTGLKKIPSNLPDQVALGGEDEAMCCAADMIKAWQKIPGALRWLYEHTSKSIIVPDIPDKIGPNTPCPCGSGKKYKKCCGE